MKYWQKKRNYRTKKNTDGTLSYIITVDGQDVEVSPEVYKAYSQEDRRERYRAEREEGLLLSLDRLAEDGMQLSYLTDMCVESAENTALRNIRKECLQKALSLLKSEDQALVHAVYLDERSFREISKMSGIPVMTIYDRVQKAIARIQAMSMENIT